MAWYDSDSWLSRAWGPYISTIIVTFIITITLPILLHYYLYRSRTLTTSPTFLVIGPSGAGKTALVTKLERGTPAVTHTSQTSLTVKANLPTSVRPSSAKYRSANDFESKTPKSLFLHDTPGHGKLRHPIFSSLSTPVKSSSASNVIFVVDSADLSAASKGLREAAEYLYDVLLTLQKVYESATSSKSRETHVLIAANKMDLFTSLPTNAVRTSLERELSKLRETKAKGISAVGTIGKSQGLGGEADEEEDKEILGGMGEGDFKFSSMAEFDVHIDVLGGNVVGDEGPGIEGWWEWIALQM